MVTKKNKVKTEAVWSAIEEYVGADPLSVSVSLHNQTTVSADIPDHYGASNMNLEELREDGYDYLQDGYAVHATLESQSDRKLVFNLRVKTDHSE